MQISFSKYTTSEKQQPGQFYGSSADFHTVGVYRYRVDDVAIEIIPINTTYETIKMRN